MAGIRRGDRGSPFGGELSQYLFAAIAKSEGMEGLIADVKMRLVHWESRIAKGSEGRKK